MRHRQAAAALLAMVLVLTACGSGGQVDAGDTTEPATRTVSHVFGESEVPTDPQRVVVLDNNPVLGTAILLEVPIVGYTAQPAGEQVLPYFDQAALADADNVGFNPIDIERVAATEPDLIIGDSGNVDEESGLYPLLAEIAPTVIFDVFADWKDNLREIAGVVGGTEQIEEGITEYETRVEQIRTDLAEEQVGEVTLANFRALDDIRIYAPTWCSGMALDAVGIQRPAEQQVDESINLSIELLGDIDADTLLYFVGSTATEPAEAAQATEAITTHPLWATLGVVQTDRAIEVDTDHWFTCGTLQAQNLVLDDIERIFMADQ